MVKEELFAWFGAKLLDLAFDSSTGIDSGSAPDLVLRLACTELATASGMMLRGFVKCLMGENYREEDARR